MNDVFGQGVFVSRRLFASVTKCRQKDIDPRAAVFLRYVHELMNKRNNKIFWRYVL